MKRTRPRFFYLEENGGEIESDNEQSVTHVNRDDDSFFSNWQARNRRIIILFMRDAGIENDYSSFPLICKMKNLLGCIL